MATAADDVLFPAIRNLLAAPTIDDVRSAIAHSTRLVSRYDGFGLHEVREPDILEPTVRNGRSSSAGADVEALLCGKARATGRTVSTIDFFADGGEQEIVEEYVDGGRLCVVRPLVAYGEMVGALALHYEGRAALGSVEFDSLRRIGECAAVALANARTREVLSSYAYTDTLTGLGNRRMLEAEFRRLNGVDLSLLLIDFDGLKQVNDTLGYEQGDRLIQTIGSRLAAGAAPGESVVRFGGDEFVVLVPHCFPGDASRRAEELTRMLDRLELPSELEPLFRGASVGWASARAGDDPAEALQRAAFEMRARKRRRSTDRRLDGDGGIPARGLAGHS